MKLAIAVLAVGLMLACGIIARFVDSASAGESAPVAMPSAEPDVCITEAMVMLMFEDLFSDGLPAMVSISRYPAETIIVAEAAGVPTMLVIHLADGCVDGRTEVPL